MQLLCQMAPYIEIPYAYSKGRAPARKFGTFVAAGGRTGASFADRLLQPGHKFCVFFLPLVTLKSLASVGAGAKGFASLALITRESVWQSVANS